MSKEASLDWVARTSSGRAVGSAFEVRPEERLEQLDDLVVGGWLRFEVLEPGKAWLRLGKTRVLVEFEDGRLARVRYEHDAYDGDELCEWL